jgi:hypothetical protein
VLSGLLEIFLRYDKNDGRDGMRKLGKNKIRQDLQDKQDIKAFAERLTGLFS